MSGFLRASFAPELLDPDIFNVWLVFWSMVMHSPEMRAVHDRTYGRYRSILESLLGGDRRIRGSSDSNCGRPTIALSALLDGLWVELQPETARRSRRAMRSRCARTGSARCAAALCPGCGSSRAAARARASARRRGREIRRPEVKSMSEGRRRDAVIIGGGHNGLVCAAYLAAPDSRSRCWSGAAWWAAPRSPRSFIRASAIRSPPTRCRC